MDHGIVPLLKRLNLDGVMVSAQLEFDGALKPVDGMVQKVFAAARETRVPRIRKGRGQFAARLRGILVLDIEVSREL